MGEPHVVSALVAKRAEVAGRIEQAERALAQWRADLGHLDGALRIFAPEIEAAEIRPKQIRNRNGMFGNGELPRLVLDALRNAGQPLDAVDVARAVAGRKGLDV